MQGEAASENGSGQMPHPGRVQVRESGDHRGKMMTYRRGALIAAAFTNARASWA